MYDYVLLFESAFSIIVGYKTKRTETMKRLILLALVLAGCFSQLVNAKTEKKSKQILTERKRIFEPGLLVGKEKVKKVFMPSFVVTGKRSLIVFCQGRLRKGGDNSLKVILSRRSEDGGLTWNDVEVLSTPINHFAISPYKAKVNGKERISFLTCIGLTVTKEYYKTADNLQKQTGIDLDEIGDATSSVIVKYYSEDDGETWQKEYLTGDKNPLYQKNSNDHTYIFSNLIGQVTEIESGRNKGRMVIAAPLRGVKKGDDLPSNFRNCNSIGSCVIYSDDKGETWKMGGVIADYTAGEASTALLNNGKDLMMIRRCKTKKKLASLGITPSIEPGDKRIAHLSKDGGMTWSKAFLIDVSKHTCFGGMMNENDRIYISLPAKTLDENKGKRAFKRSRGTVFYSDNDGESWNSKMIEAGPYSYSTIGKIDRKRNIVFFTEGYHGEIGVSYRIFNDEWLEN